MAPLHQHNLNAMSNESTDNVSTEHGGAIDKPAVLRRPFFHPIHIDTAERFVGVRQGVRVSIALGDMGLWEVDAWRGPECLVDEYVAAKDMDHAIAQTLVLAGL